MSVSSCAKCYTFEIRDTVKLLVRAMKILANISTVNKLLQRKLIAMNRKTKCVVVGKPSLNRRKKFTNNNFEHNIVKNNATIVINNKSKTTTTQSTLISRRKHNANARHNCSERRQQCDHRCVWPQCGRRFSRLSHLRYHQSNVHLRIRRKFHCDQCGKRFRTGDALRKHQLMHQNSETRFKCQQCGKCFSQNKYLTTHSIVHNSESRQFVCRYRRCYRRCMKRFSLKSHLIDHRNRHYGYKRFKCDYSDCDMRFVTSTELTQHYCRRHKQRNS